MKRIIMIIAVFAIHVPLFGHYLWVDTKSIGHLGETQEIRVYYGEYSYGVMEKVSGDAFTKVADFILWVMDDEGRHTHLEVEPAGDHYLARYTPLREGTYTVLLNNDSIDVIDYTAFDFGIFKTHYHAVTTFSVGGEHSPSRADNPSGITVQTEVFEGDEVKLKVLYKAQPLAEHEVTIFMADQWSKTLKTDAEGMVSFKMLWDTPYIVEVTQKEEVPGTFRGAPYEFVWHCVTQHLTP